MATGTVTLTYSATSITISAPEYPGEWRKDLNQWRARAMGGRVVSVTRALGTQTNPVFHWSTMSDAHYDLLEAFIYTTVAGSTQPFTFTDWDGVARTVRYLGGLERAQQQDFDIWVVDLELAVVA